MKTYTRLFFILTIISLTGGLFGKTPLDEPATHQLYVSGFCWFLTLLFIEEHFRTRSKSRKS
ncbi:hypothetical protein [Butyricimonas sp.]|uniref:hypothetical protein n=1 Tax=Butyricimonas sp. TaxID=1969738 RepID=UPI001AFCEB34|nr:hypothetical protein [Butyricimonas sp.]MBO4960585.1 hypothetical protein [Butyricimonas sp.]